MMCKMCWVHLMVGFVYHFRSDLLLNAQVSPDEMNTYVEKEPMGVCVIVCLHV